MEYGRSSLQSFREIPKGAVGETQHGYGSGSARGSLVSVRNEVVAEEPALRPVERVVRRLVDGGVDPAEVAWRLRRSPRSVKQILELGSRRQPGPNPATSQHVLRPLERRILAWRATGASYAEIGARFRRSPGFIRQVEELARAKLARTATDAQ